MPNIFPDAAGGGVVVTDPTGAVLTGPFSTIVNGYVPPATFHMACPVMFYGGAACDMRPQPYQINAITSELLALAAAMDPTGTWSCGRVTNLAAAYHNAMASLSGVPIVDPFGVVAGYAMAGPISPAPAAIFAVNQSNFGPEFQIGTRIPNQITLLYEPSTQLPEPGTQAPQIGTSTDFARADHSHKETVTQLGYDAVTKSLTFTDEAGATHVLDLSGLAIDMNVTGGTWNATTGILTLIGDDGMPSVAINLAALKSVNTTNSVTGNGDTASVQLVNDMATPGASMHYGTNAAGVKGWVATPLPATTAPAHNAISPAIGTDTAHYALADHVHAETLTSLGYNAVTKTLVYQDEAGAVQTLDLSALAVDMSISGGSYNTTTGVLTLTGSGGAPNVVINLASLKAVNVAASITGDGDTYSLQLVNDVAAPGATKYYGTNAAGVKGWQAMPAAVPDVLTTLTYNAATKALTYTDEAGAVNTLDLSGLAIDMTVTGATYTAATGILTLTESGGGPTITIDLSTLKAVNVTNSITGNGDGSALQFVNDLAAPGASMLYGTNAAGVKGWYAQPTGGGGAAVSPFYDPSTWPATPPAIGQAVYGTLTAMPPSMGLYVDAGESFVATPTYRIRINGGSGGNLVLINTGTWRVLGATDIGNDVFALVRIA